MAPATQQTPSELFLIDGNSLAYRAFFALPESIATADGRPTNAIYGFASMMTKLLIEHNPRAVIVAWDAGMSGRDKEYSEYKAGRRSRPDLLREQWPHLEPLAEAFGFRNVKVEGWEADDVIATLTHQASGAGIPVMIVSGDRDVYQLVGDGVRVMTTSRGVTDTKIYDREGVVERYGVPPELVPDLIGLKGDTSDNIPGVPGIGDKTAAQLLQRFGTLEKVLDSVDEISGAKRKENLTEHAEDARISKQLATMKLDVEVPEGVVEEADVAPDLARLRDPACVEISTPKAAIGSATAGEVFFMQRTGFIDAASRNHPCCRRAACPDDLASAYIANRSRVFLQHNPERPEHPRCLCQLR